MAETAEFRIANDNGESIRILANVGETLPRVRPEPAESSADEGLEEGWATQRLPALIFFVIATALSALSMWRGMDPLETGALSGMGAISAICLLFALPSDRIFLRGSLAVCAGLFASIASILVLPAYGYWPATGGIIIVAALFLAAAAIARSRLCVAVALGLLCAQLFDSSGLVELPEPARPVLIGLLFGAVMVAIYSRSRAMATAGLMIGAMAGLSLFALTGMTAVQSFSVLAVIAAAIAIGLRTVYRHVESAADMPMVAAALLAGLLALCVQLVLSTETGAETLAFAQSLPEWAMPSLIAAQMLALVATAFDLKSDPMRASELILQQLAFGGAALLILAPNWVSDSTGLDPAHALTGLLAMSIMAVSVTSLFRAWQDDRPVLAGIAVLVLLMQVLIGLRIVSGDFDLGVAGLVCGGVAFALAAIMAIAPRKQPAEAVS